MSDLIMDDPLLETKLDFDEYLKQVSERSVSKDRGANRSKSVDVRSIRCFSLRTLTYHYSMLTCRFLTES